ncbi:hypothetical protein PT2222_260113 [Paraburkholderia tropica]
MRRSAAPWCSTASSVSRTVSMRNSWRKAWLRRRNSIICARAARTGFRASSTRSRCPPTISGAGIAGRAWRRFPPRLWRQRTKQRNPATSAAFDRCKKTGGPDRPPVCLQASAQESVRRSPALVAADVVARDERGRHLDHRIGGLLAVHDVVADLHGGLRHFPRVLARGRLHERVALERGFDVGRAVHRGDHDIAAMQLLGGQVAADRLRIVDGEYAVELRKAREVALHRVHAAFARAFAVLIVGENLDARRLREHLLAAVHAVDHRRDLRAVFDNDVALAVDLLREVFAGDRAGLHVVGLHGGVGARGAHVHGQHHDAGRARLAHGGLDGFRIGGVQQDHVDVRRDEVVDLRELLVQIVVGGHGRDLRVRIDLFGLRFRALHDGHEVRIAQRTHGDADRLQLLVGGVRALQGAAQGEGGNGANGDGNGGFLLQHDVS